MSTRSNHSKNKQHDSPRKQRTKSKDSKITLITKETLYTKYEDENENELILDDLYTFTTYNKDQKDCTEYIVKLSKTNLNRIIFSATENNDGSFRTFASRYSLEELCRISKSVRTFEKIEEIVGFIKKNIKNISANTKADLKLEFSNIVLPSGENEDFHIKLAKNVANYDLIISEVFKKINFLTKRVITLEQDNKDLTQNLVKLQIKLDKKENENSIQKLSDKIDKLEEHISTLIKSNENLKKRNTEILNDNQNLLNQNRKIIQRILLHEHMINLTQRKILNINAEKYENDYTEIYITIDVDDEGKTSRKNNKGQYIGANLGTNTQILNYEFNELNEDNCEMFINNVQVPFNKFHIFKDKGKHYVKLKFRHKLTTCRKMFNYSRHILNISFKNFHTDLVTDMSEMFYGLFLVRTIDVSSFDTKNVESMYGMFYHCNNLRHVDVSHFDTRKVKDISYMFNWCCLMKDIDLRNFSVENIQKTEYYCCGTGGCLYSEKNKKFFDKCDKGKEFMLFYEGEE